MSSPLKWERWSFQGLRVEADGFSFYLRVYPQWQKVSLTIHGNECSNENAGSFDTLQGAKNKCAEILNWYRENKPTEGA